EQIGGWLNPEIYEAVNKMENMLDWNEVQIAYQIGKQYFTIQTAEDGYDYTFYNEDYQEDDGGIYDNPTIYVDEAASDILEDKGYSLEDAKVVDYEDLMADVEEVQEEQMQRIQLEKNCPASIFEGFRREEAMQTYEGIAMQFIRSKGYLTIQATEEGYSFIFYDSDLHEIQSGDYDNPDASIQEAAYEILKSERMDDLECVKVDYKEFEEMTIQHSKDLLQEGELRATSEIGRNELALNSLSRADVERGVLYHAQAVLEDMGMEQEVELLAARVYGSRSRQDLYREDSDLDVVLSYKGDIREDSFFNALNKSGIAMAGIKVDINPIAEERITLAEYIKESEKYLDQQEIKKLAVDLDNFSYDVDTYEYNDTVENREEQVEKLTEDILNKKTETIKDWLLEVSEESDIDSDVITARSLLSRLEDTERFSIFDKQPEQEQPEATISFYVAECMEFPVMGEYHNNLTLEEAIKIYESIPSERLHGIKGIGFDLQDGDEDYSGEYGLMSGDRIDRDLIDMIPHYKESPLVQKAINDMEKYLNEKHGKVQEAEQTVEVKQEVSEAPVKKESVSVEENQTQKKE
ncbi:MAG: LPD16 domain-containing protein, partial [Blautia wexlerae]